MSYAHCPPDTNWKDYFSTHALGLIIRLKNISKYLYLDHELLLSNIFISGKLTFTRNKNLK